MTDPGEPAARDGPLVLTVNAGSSSLRVGLFAASPDRTPSALLRVRVEPLGGDSAPEFAVLTREVEMPAPVPGVEWPHDHGAALRAVLNWLADAGWLEQVAAVGHRVVHGGGREGPLIIDAALLAALAELSPLAPLHQPHAIAAIRALCNLVPDSLQVACLDTAFHRTLPARARRYALPTLPAGVEALRHGFHGLSCASVAGTLQRLAPAARRVVVAHLGAGASLSALQDGISVDTTMGMTPLDGVPMATRSGALDPGILLWLVRQHGYDADTLEHLLYREAGLLGLSGISGDMRRLLAADEPRARDAVEIFAYQCAKAVAALAVPLAGLDALVFTGGIGERSPAVRAMITAHCAWLGVDLDPAANDHSATRISRGESKVSVWVIPSDEEQVIAGQAFACLAAAQT